MATTVRLPGFCSCGLVMVPINPGSTLNMCTNCDTVQETELRGNRRRPTDRDYAFTKVWRQRILSMFPGT